jgi:hypothetical protein
VTLSVLREKTGGEEELIETDFFVTVAVESLKGKVGELFRIPGLVLDIN